MAEVLYSDGKMRPANEFDWQREKLTAAVSEFQERELQTLKIINWWLKKELAGRSKSRTACA